METTSEMTGGNCRNRKPLAELRWPSPSLEACFYAALIRDTRGCDLLPKERFNHYSAAPLCTLSWVFEGECLLVEDGSQGFAIPRISLSGPQTRPITSWNKGPVCAMSVAFFPDAFQRLTGIYVPDYVDRTVCVDEVFSGDWLDMFYTIGESGSPQTGFKMLVSRLELAWKKVQSDSGPVASIADWSRVVAVNAAKSGAGRSIRQIERRIKAWTGMSQRDLDRHARLERSFLLASRASREGQLAPAEIAHAAGYSDQSHMGRSVRRHTGLSPMQLMQRIETEEAYWSYRLFAEMEKA